MLYVNTLDMLDALEASDLDTEVDFSRLINEIDNNTIDTYELVDNERFIPLADWLVSDRDKQYLDNIDMLDKEIDKALSEGEI